MGNIQKRARESLERETVKERIFCFGLIAFLNFPNSDGLHAILQRIEGVSLQIEVL